jgi:hypothetical protein
MIVGGSLVLMGFITLRHIPSIIGNAEALPEIR